MQKKSRKGLTLFEIIISIAVYAVLAALLTEVMTLVNATMRSTNQLNDRLAFEAKYADNLRTRADFTERDSRVLIVYGTGANDMVRYDASVRDTTGKKINQVSLSGEEYTASYTPPRAILGTDYHANTNYKFMIFNKVGFVQDAKPGGAFQVKLQLLAGKDANKIDHITIEEVDDGAGGKVTRFYGSYTGVQNGPFDAAGIGEEIIITMRNDAPEVADALTTSQKDWTGKVKVTIYENIPGKGTVEKVADATIEFYTAIKVSGWINYYPDCVVTYDNSTRDFVMLDT